MIKLPKWFFIIPPLILLPIFSYLYFINRENITFKQTPFEEKHAVELKELKEKYGIDEYKYDWNWNVEGYDLVEEYIKPPKYTLTNEQPEVNEKWTLKDGYILELNCPKQDLENLVSGDPKHCTLKYNDTEVSNVRYEVWEREGRIEGEVSLVLYSSDDNSAYGRYEYLVVGEWERGSKDRVTFYKLEEGKTKRMLFLNKDSKEDSWIVEHPMSFKLFNKKEGMKFVTLFYDPSMFVGRGVFRIWNMEEDGFRLEKTIGDISSSLLH